MYAMQEGFDENITLAFNTITCGLLVFVVVSAGIDRRFLLIWDVFQVFVFCFSFK